MNLRFALLLSLVFLSPVAAQDEDLPPDEVADLIDLYVERGGESLRQGSYDEAKLRFQKALEKSPGHRGARLGVVAADMAVGEYDKAMAQLEKLFADHPGDREGRVIKARIHLLRGKDASARETLREVLKTGGEGPDLVGLDARIVLAEALARRGKRDEARDVLDHFIKLYEDRREMLAEQAFNADRLRLDPAKGRPISREMTLIGRALRIYVELSPLDYNYADNAIELLGYAREIDPENWDAAIEYVRVFRVEKQRAMAKARTILQTTDKRNPELADLYVEVARSVRIGFNEGEARRYAETALRINPNHAGARAIIARVLLEDNEYGAADDQITAGLEFNHKHRELLALKATLELLTGDNEAFEEGMKDLLAIDPTYGEGFHIAALVVAARQRRYDRAAALTRRALQIDAMNTDAHASLGIFLANLGRAEEAIAALSKSRKLFPFSHPIRDNFRDVLDYVTKTMVEQKTKHFVIRYDPTEYDITSLFLPQLLEGCWDDMTKRYGFTPKAPVLVEVFKKADDFSVRTMGILGIPALGACFGGLITLDSPQALGPNQFSWAATARHEFGHVMSLQISGGQVPRWFTEGLSVFEEKPLDPGWGLNEAFERQIHTAYHTDSLPKIGKFDAMFRTNRVALAYHVGGLMIDFLHKRSGEKGIVKALELYGKHRPTREVFKKAFDLELEDFDALFLEYVGKRVEGYKIVPRYGWVRGKLAEQVSKNPKDGEALVKLAWAHFQARRNVDAGVYLDRAKDILVPGHLSATLLQARLAQRAGRGPQARKLIEQFFAAGGEDFDARMIMAAVYRQGGETAKYIDFLNKAKAAWPLNVTGNNPYVLLRRYYLQESRNDDALKELEGQTRIASVNLNIRLVLAREYMGAGRLDDAVKLLDEALNLHTFDRRAHTMMVAAARQKKLWPRALRSGRCLVRLLPGDADGEETAIAWARLGELFLEAGEVDEAQRALKEAEKQAEGIDVPAVGKLKEKLDQGR